jgi:RNA polymerase sigma factor (TIGR02999 family)
MGSTKLEDEAFYEELRRLAREKMRGERAGHTLDPTALAHEAWLRISKDADPSLVDPDRFAPIAAVAMRRILVEHARARQALKRSSDRALGLDTEPRAPEPDAWLVALDEALGRLAARDADLARIVELRFFGGQTVEDTARLVGVSPRTVKRSWAVAKGWLAREMGGGDAQ